MTEQTTVFEMRELIDETAFSQSVADLITPAAVERHRYRDYDELVRVLERADHQEQIIDELDTDNQTLLRWVRAYGLEDQYLPDKTRTFAHLRQAEPDQVRSGD